MNERSVRQPTCPACRKSGVEEVVQIREFWPNKQQVAVETLSTRCTHCSTQFTTGVQHDENLKRLAARREHPAYQGLLLGEDIVQLRMRYGLIQRDAAMVFGTGKIAFSRYENEVTYPGDSLTKLLMLAIEMPAALKLLADKAGVSVPLWGARCEDERRKKLAVFKSVPASAESKAVWSKRPRHGMHGQQAWPAAMQSSSLKHQDLKVDRPAMNDSVISESQAS
jgi:putative zinc finger/helix-turn-helix YgiT family protein